MDMGPTGQKTSGPSSLRLKSQCRFLLPVCPWVSSVTSASFSVTLSKTGVLGQLESLE